MIATVIGSFSEDIPERCSLVLPGGLTTMFRVLKDNLQYQQTAVFG